MQDFYTTIVGDGRANGMLMVRVGLDVPDAKMRENVSRSMPVLRDAYLRSLMAYTATHVRLDTAPDAVAIADRLQGITDRALDEKGRQGPCCARLLFAPNRAFPPMAVPQPAALG